MFRRVNLVVLGLVVAVVASGCGNRLDHDRLRAAAIGPTGPEQASADPGSVVDEVEPAGVLDDAVPDSLVDPTPTPTAESGQTPDGTSAPTPSGSTQQCTGSEKPIKIGTVGQQSGIIGSVTYRGVQAVQTWVAATNAKGGLNCHKIEYIVKDDGGDPSRHQSMLRELVEQSKVAAIVYADAPLTGGSGVSYLTDKNVPVIGSETGSPWFYSSPMFFPQASSGDQTLFALFGAAAEAAKASGEKVVGTLSCTEASICSRLNEIASEGASRFGLSLAYRGSASIAQPDYTSQCQAAKQAGVQTLLFAADTNSLKRLARSCNSVNYRPTFATAGSVASLDLADDPLLENLVVPMNVLPWFLSDNPAIADYQATLKRFGPGLPIDASTSTAWVAAKLFELAVLSTDDPTTSAGIVKGLTSIKGNDLGGLTQPLTFTAGKSATPMLCYWFVQVQGGKYVAPTGGNRVCS